MTLIRLRVGNQYVAGEDRVSLSFTPHDPRSIIAVAEVAQPAQPPRLVTGREGLRAILAEINNAPDPFAEAGLWLTHITNAITKIIREDDKS